MMSFLKKPSVRAALALILIVAIGVIAREHLHFIGDGWRELEHANNKWISLAVLALALSMVAQAEVMVILMRSAGVQVKRLSANMLGLAANAWSATFPGGPALSAAMIFREQMKWGATPVIASWYMVLSGVLASGGMAILAIGSIFFLGLTVKPLTLALSVVGVIALAIATNWVATHPRQVENWLLRQVRRFNRWQRKPEDRFTEAILGLGQQLSAVKLPLPRLSAAITASLLNWIFEILCLMACIFAIGAEPPVAGVILSFLTAKVAGQAQVTPGGLGMVDLALTSALVSFGAMPSVQAFASVIVFRMLSFIGLALVGWIVFFVTKLANPRASEETEPAGIAQDSASA